MPKNEAKTAQDAGTPRAAHLFPVPLMPPDRHFAEVCREVLTVAR